MIWSFCFRISARCCAGDLLSNKAYAGATGIDKVSAQSSRDRKRFMVASRDLHVKEEVQHITILHDVLFTFCAHLAGFLGALLPFVGNKIGKGNGLGTDEAALEIRVNHTGGLWRRIPLVNSPSAHLLHTGSEVRLQTKKVITGANHTIQARLPSWHTRQPPAHFPWKQTHANDQGTGCSRNHPLAHYPHTWPV